MSTSRSLRLASVLALCLVLPGCLGRFAMTGAVTEFNVTTFNGQWPREIAFVGLHIIPVYPVCAFGDLFIVNSIEFWSGTNPVSGESALTMAGASEVASVEATRTAVLPSGAVLVLAEPLAGGSPPGVDTP